VGVPAVQERKLVELVARQRKVGVRVTPPLKMTVLPILMVTRLLRLGHRHGVWLPQQQQQQQERRPQQPRHREQEPQRQEERRHQQEPQQRRHREAQLDPLAMRPWLRTTQICDWKEGPVVAPRQLGC
jgi:hypothetical protein